MKTVFTSDNRIKRSEVYLNSLCGITDGLQRKEDEMDMLCLVNGVDVNPLLSSSGVEVGLISMISKSDCGIKRYSFGSGLRHVY